MNSSEKLAHYAIAAFESAYAQALAACHNDEVPVGAVVVQNQVVISAERNRILELRDPTAHAELLAIRKAASVLRNERLTDCELFTTLEPCAMCAGAIVMARIRTVYFLTQDDKLPGLRCVLTLEGHNHIPAIQHVEYPELPARELLKNFFYNKRMMKSGQKSSH